jgi:DNA-binding MarR family transcriptional regulator/catechol 2,3-dioxygenase-like lactoylglutathione lyase family enzyme
LTVKLLDHILGCVDESLNEFATPALMRMARGVYASSIRVQLRAIGIDDLPRNGSFILAGIDASGAPRPELPSELGVTKQAVSQVIDALVSRGYLERGTDPGDRRRLALELTERGQQALDAVIAGVEAVDRQLEERVSHERVETLRSVLIEMAQIKSDGLASGAALGRPARQFRRFSPIFPVHDLAAALEHYAALGFTTTRYPGVHQYGFADRDGTQLHLQLHRDHVEEHRDRGRGASAYLFVRDADDLYEEWTRPGIGGITLPVSTTDYDMREGSHSDPDGNVIRFGSPVEQ